MGDLSMYKRISLSPRTRRALAPRPVHPISIRSHGLFGMPFVKEHMYIDDRWTPSSVAEEFSKMTELLSKRLVMGRHQIATRIALKRQEVAKLKHQCRSGHERLKNMLFNENSQKVRSLLLNHKDMLRLYPRLPMQQIEDNMNQRTFVLRKEVDRLRHELKQKKALYKEKLNERAQIENRLYYMNEFVIAEEKEALVFAKHIENSNLRIKAIRSVNSTYRKIMQVLHHDGIFYEPILRSLNKDIEDQEQFIKHVLFLGSPAIVRFRKLGENVRLKEDLAHRNAMRRAAVASKLRKSPSKTTSKMEEDLNPPIDLKDMTKRYARETMNMRILRSQLDVIEETIKQMQTVTLSSRPKDIYPRIKTQFKNNVALYKIITNDLDRLESLNVIQSRAKVLAGVLYNNMSPNEQSLQDRIRDLRKAINLEDIKEKQTIEKLKNRGDVLVLLRYTYWNLFEIVRHVGRTIKPSREQYAVSYLKLPLLKFDMLSMRAYPPEGFEKDLDKIGQVLKYKLHEVVKVFKNRFSSKAVKKMTVDYNNLQLKQFLLSSQDSNEEHSVISTVTLNEPSGLEEAKILTEVPNRRSIKDSSNKIVEAELKKDD